jgi:hypothetical protein
MMQREPWAEPSDRDGSKASGRQLRRILARLAC